MEYLRIQTLAQNRRSSLSKSDQQNITVTDRFNNDTLTDKDVRESIPAIDSNVSLSQESNLTTAQNEDAHQQNTASMYQKYGGQIVISKLASSFEEQII